MKQPSEYTEINDKHDHMGLHRRADVLDNGHHIKHNTGRLTTEERNDLPDSAFAGPDRSYPINDANHARVALARAAQNASPREQTVIKRRVEKRYPSIDVS